MKRVFTLYFSLRILLTQHRTLLKTFRSSPPEVFLGRGVLKICNKFTGEPPCRREISMKLQCNFNEITLRHECFPVNLLHIFRTPLPKNAYAGLFLNNLFLMFTVFTCFKNFIIYFSEVGSFLWWVFFSLR